MIARRGWTTRLHSDLERRADTRKQNGSPAAGRIHAHFSRLARLRGDDAAFGGDGGFADRLRVGELVAHRMAFDIGGSLKCCGVGRGRGELITP